MLKGTLGTCWILIFTISASAQQISESFTGLSIDTSKWGDKIEVGNATFTQREGRLEFSAPTVPLDGGQAILPLIQTLEINQNWEAVLEVNGNHTPASGGNYSIGFGIVKTGNLSESLYIEYFAERTSSTYRGFLTALDGEDDVLGEEFSADLGIQKALIKIAYNAAVKTITTSFDRDGTNTGFGWQVLGTFGLAGTGGSTANSNWNLNGTNTLTLFLGGYAEDTTVPAGTVWLDNFALTIGSSSAKVETALILKEISYVQISPTETTLRLNSEDPYYGGPFGFSVFVEGENLAGTGLRLIVPSGSTVAQTAWFNGGYLLYDPQDNHWVIGALTNNSGSQSLQTLNSMFASGTYELVLPGGTASLTLPEDAFPMIPKATLTGGEWQNGVYMVRPGQTVNISLPSFPTFGSNLDGRFALGVDELSIELERFYSQSPTNSPLEISLSSTNFIPGTNYVIWLEYNAIVDSSDVIPAALIAAAFSTITEVTIAVAPTLSVTRQSNQIRVEWAGGTLERASSPSGPWTSLDSLTSPQMFPQSQTQEFFRVRMGL